MNEPNRSELRGLPLYRGVEGSRFIYHGEWSDPEVYYKGYLFNAWDIEDDISEEELSDSDAVESRLEMMLGLGCGTKYAEGNGTYTMDRWYNSLFSV